MDYRGARYHDFIKLVYHNPDPLEARRIFESEFTIPEVVEILNERPFSKDKYGDLYAFIFHRRQEPVFVVKVKNSTPEPDGSVKDYWIRIPPDRIFSPKRAIAWTFGLTDNEYEPVIES